MAISNQTEQAPTSVPFLSTTVSSSEPNATAIDHNDSLTQISGTLGGIIILILAGAWLVKKLGFAPKKMGNEQIIKVKSRCSLGNKERIVVVEVNNECLVLGVTTQNISLLHQYSSEPESTTGLPVEPLTFQSLLKKKQEAAKFAASVTSMHK
ncbi:flagellar biosynthetic protein FliO [Providencia rettgeri]|uniref:flagellar biosynthetic protein FliO n=1 Tax=Providencia rettgeri TaxID=587 RepID=UPI0018C47274|nr:flagellar biosynthetic protein FliO [Providencia rettgeri]MBG5923225.1 flagellar biosynthetic protein FliO [Providencia rettgeri]MBS0914903.1 flagellar biosynthetic protein FliO [Providencia rettgeri]HEM8212552.1 flagellar biosynthetic protein FliO [Providencia rettgeri]